ncbi:MAG TPA: GDSL-type esterase/lipase family protein [Cyclobacteriaceae bacterium]|nr:GDSL-type esterase/lipase family protein [Cyclobacteriaceae bacterium]
MRRTYLIFVLFLSAIFSQAQSPIKVACIGNSITYGDGLSRSEAYPAQLEKMLGDKFVVRNFGVSGRTLLRQGDFPYIKEQAYQDALNWKADVVVIKLGTNDSKPQNWKFEKDFEADYRDMIRAFKRANADVKIFACLPVPVANDAWGISGKIVQEEIIPIIREVASKEKVEVVNLFRALDKHRNKFPDGVHPNAEASKIIAETVYKSITKKPEAPK